MRRAISWPAPWIAALPGAARPALWIAALFLVACGAGDTRAPEEPPGLLMVARRPDLSRLLERLATLEGTPLGREARALAEALPGCGLVEAISADGSLAGLETSLACVPPRSALAVLHRELGSDAVAFVMPEYDGGRVRGRIRFDRLDQAEIELVLPAELARGAAGSLLPGSVPPGPAVLSGADTLLHARVRPVAGLDLAALVPEGSQGDQMFRLKSRLFAGAVLDGTWEAAVYLPRDGETMPRAALALGVRAKAAAEAAAEEFVAQLEETWSIRRAPFETSGAEGACLPELRILPDFAPCYVATSEALVVGWNAGSVRQALDGPGGVLGAGGGAVIELARFPEADLRMARAAGIPPEALVPGPWRRLRASGRSGVEGVLLRLRLETGAEAPPAARDGV
ncbi:MAG: hypothetical protein ACR2P8_00605 [Myxococcota bacterium]